MTHRTFIPAIIVAASLITATTASAQFGGFNFTSLTFMEDSGDRAKTKTCTTDCKK